jgi:hypothetical protein
LVEGILLDAIVYASMTDENLRCAKADASGLFCIVTINISESEATGLKWMQPVAEKGK